MSTSIDQRVVEMRFDNAQFESGVKTSLSTLDRLKQALNLFGPKNNGLEELGVASSRLTSSFQSSGLAGAIQSVSDRFSTLGIVGMTVIQNLTNSALNFAKNFVTAIPRKIANGGWARAMKIETAKFQIEGLGTAWEKVAGDIDYGVSDTAYGLDSAAAVASQLMQSGIEIGGVYEGANKHISMMGKALLAVSGVAGMTSRSYEEIGDLFTSVAGQGRVTGDTLSRMGMKGLNAAADLAKFFNGVNSGAYEASDSVTESIKKITKGAEVSETEVRDFVTKKMVDADMFYESMWAMYGEHAKDANNTLTGILSNINAAFSKIGADFATPLIKNAVEPLQKIRLIINEVRKQLTPTKEVWEKLAPVISKTATAMLEGIDLSWMKTFFEAIQNLIFDVALVVKPIQEAFRDIFPPATADQFQSAADWFLGLSEKLMISEEAAEKLKRTFSGIFAVFDIVKEAIKAVLSAILPMGDGLFDIGDGILDVTANFGDFLVNLRNSIKESNFFTNVIEKIKEAFRSFSQIINGNFGPSIDVIKSGFKALREVLADKFKLDFSGLDEQASPIRKIFDIISIIVNKAFELLKSAVPNVLSLISKLGSGIKDFFVTVKEILTGGDLGQALKNTTFAVVLYNFKNFAIQLRKILNMFTGGKNLGGGKGGFLSAITNFFSGSGTRNADISNVLVGITDSLTQFQKSLNASYFLQIGAALLMLAFAMNMLSQIDGISLGKATLAISTMMGELVGSVSVLKSLPTNNLTKIGGTLIALSVAVLILSAALKKVSDIPFEGLISGLFAITILLTDLTLVALFLGSFGKTIPKGASALIVMAIAVNILATAVKKLADIPFEDLMSGLLAVTILVGELTVAALLLGNFGGRIRGGMTGLIAMAAAVLILTSSVRKLGELDPENLAKGVKAVTVLIADLAGVMIAAKFGKMNINIGLGIIGIAAALLILAKAVDAFGGMDTDALKQGLLGVTAVLVVVAGFGILAGLSKHILSSAIALVIIAEGLKVLAGVVAQLGALNLDNMLQGLAGIAALLLMIGAFAGIIQTIAPTFILTSIAMVIMGGALMIFASAVAFLGGLPLGVLIQGLLSLALGLAAIGAISAVLGVVSPLILAFGLALGVVGVAVGIASAGIFLLAVAFTSLGAALPAVVMMLAAAIPIVIRSLGEGIVQLVEVIGNSAEAIAQAVTQVVLAVLATLQEVIPAIVEFVLDVVQKVLESIAIHGPEIVTAACDILINMAAAFREKIPDLISIAAELMLAFINGMADSIRENTDATIEAFDNLVSAIIESANKWLDHFFGTGDDFIQKVAEGIGNAAGDVVSAAEDMISQAIEAIKNGIGNVVEIGSNFVAGFIEGIGKGAKGLWDTCVNMGANAISALTSKGGIDSNSPSKKTEEQGKNFDDGFEKGIKDNAKGVTNAVKDLGSNAVKPLTDTATKASETINDVFEGAGKSVNEFARRYGIDLNPAVEENTELVEENTESVTKNTEAVQNGTKATEEAKEAEEEYFDIMDFGKDVVVAFHERFGAAFEELGDTAPLEMSKAAVEALALATYEASEKAEEATNKSKKSAEDSKSKFEKIKEAFAGLRDSLVKTIDGQMDIFKEFDKKTELTGEQLLKNMRSQINGIAEWSAKIQELAARGIDQGLLKKLAEMGPQGYEYVNAFTQMTATELQEANQLFATSLQVPTTAANEILASYAYSGISAVDAFVQAVNQNASQVNGAVTAMAAEGKATLDAEAKKFDESGRIVDEQTGQGVTDNGEIVETATQEMIAQVITIANDYAFKNGSSISINLLNGIAQGLTENASIASDAAIGAMNHLNSKGIETPQEINSPSKVWARYGKFLDLGMAQGIKQFSNRIVNEATATGDSATKALAHAINQISAAGLDEDMTPVIAPVLDLSEIESGLGVMNSMMADADNPYIAAVPSGIGSVVNPNYRQMSNLAAAINGMQTGAQASNNIQITINTQPGQNSKEIADMVIRRLDNSIARRKAVFA